MQTYLFAWNPSRWDWEDLDKDIQKVNLRGYLDGGWSAGNRKNIPIGSRFFLIRLGSGGKGIIGAGFTTSEPYYDKSWQQSRGNSAGKALYVNLRFDNLSNEPLIKWDELKKAPLAAFHWSIQASGIHVPTKIASSLENLWGQKTKNKTNAPAKVQCWLIKTTEGGPGFTDYWANFLSEKVVSVGWPDIEYDPSKFNNLDEYRQRLKSKYKWDSTFASSIIFKFARDWQENDIAIICTGYAPNQTKDVYVNGIARIGSYFFDKKSDWWCFKRHAVINPVDRYIPVKLFQKFLIKSARQTIHGPFSQGEFRAFAKAAGFALPDSKIGLEQKTTSDSKAPKATSSGGGFGSAAENKKIETAAVRVVTRWYKARGWHVSDVSAQCLGYDLHCVKGSNILHVEVKGSSGCDHQFIITPNEMKRWAVDPLFVLSLVTNTKSKPAINQFQGPVAMKSFSFNALSYMAVSTRS